MNFTGFFFLALDPSPERGEIGKLPWNWSPWILASLALPLLLYVLGLWRMRRIARIKIALAARAVCFAAGIASLFLVLITPFDALDDELFAAHMLQHLVLMMIAPPLLVLGRPAIIFLWSFPLRTRRAMGRAWVRSGLRSLAHSLFSPLSVWLLCSGALWFWHLPGPFRWALKSELVHAIEHTCFFVPALLFWALVLEPAAHRRMSYGVTLLLVAALGMENGLLGAILTFSGHPLYPAYERTTGAWGLTPLEDQQIAGLLMWIPAGLIHLTTLGFSFVAWMRAAERRAVLEARLHVKGLTARRLFLLL